MRESDTIKVMGHSGFEVVLLNEQTVRKSGRFPEARRLKKQIEKQRLFHLRQERGEIRVPAIYSEHEGDEVYHADMEYIAAADLIQISMDSLNEFWDSSRPISVKATMRMYQIPS